LASRHHSLDMSETKDMIELIRAFEQHNSLRIGVSLTVEDRDGRLQMAVSVHAFARGVVDAEPAPLASVLLYSFPTNQRTLMGLLTHALYALDFRLAVNEFDKTRPTA